MSLESLDLDTISRLVDQCDPQRPLDGNSPFYIPLDRDPPVRGEQSCVDLMERVILHAKSKNISCQLFTGFPGTGKTTELRQLERRFVESQQPTAGHVLFVPFEQYIQIYQPISVSDVLRVLAFCITVEADRVRQSAEPAGDSFLRRFFDFVKKALPRTAELKSVEFDFFGATLMLEMRNNRSVYQEIEQAIHSRFQHFVTLCNDVIRQGIAQIRATVGSRADRFIVIADGLEKLDSMDGSDREQIEASAETLFVAMAEFLRLPCHVIYTFPVWLRFRSPLLGSVYTCEPSTLPMISLKPRDDGSEPGLKKLYELIKRRIERPKLVFGDDPERALRPLLVASGGYPRDALRMVRTLLQRENEFPIAHTAIEREIRALQRTYHDAVLGTYADVLKYVHDFKRIPNETPEKLRTFGQLFSRFLVLAYRNGEEWFDLHPLVRKAPALLRQFGPKDSP